jgi:hypothetical protein
MHYIFGNAFYRGRRLCICGRTNFCWRSVILIGNVGCKFADGVSNLVETFLVKRASLGINLR